MQLTDFSSSIFNGAAQERDPNFYEFFYEAVLQGAETERLGRPVYKDVLHLRTIIPGGRNIVCRPATDDDKIKYKRQWEAFEANEQQRADGLPLEQWPGLTKSQILELRYNKIYTVEQLASVPDSALQDLGIGSSALRDRAKMYLDQAKGLEPITKLQAENSALRAEVDYLKEEFKKLAAGNKKLEEKKHA